MNASSSAAESCMEDSTANVNRGEEPQFSASKDTVAAENGAREGEAAEVWASFNNNFRQVQSVLDRNRALIQQVNDNHQSKIADNMVKNVALIQEINGNISKVVSLYSGLSSNFFTMYDEQRNQDDSDSNEKA